LQLSYIIRLIVPVDAHACESVIKRWNIEIIRLDGQQNPCPENITEKINVFCEARTVFIRGQFQNCFSVCSLIMTCAAVCAFGISWDENTDNISPGKRCFREITGDLLRGYAFNSWCVPTTG